MKQIKPGIYKHFKGNLYEVLEISRHSETLEEFVTYRALYESKEYGKNVLWVRPKQMFLETVTRNGKKQPRFTFMSGVSPHPRVGVGVIIRKAGKVLMGRRRNAHGDGTWSVPGGNLEYAETAVACAKREVFEETGIRIKNVNPVLYTNDYFAKEGKHYITLWMLSDYASGRLVITEPDKYIESGWYAWGKLPRPQFLPLKHLVQTKFDPFSA